MECETTGRTVEEAVNKALESLGIRKENAEVEVKDEPSQGIFGIIGNKTARVAVRPIKLPGEYMEAYLKEMLEFMEIEGLVEVTEDNEKLKAEISGLNAGILIGRRGRILSDMQYLLSVIMRRQFYGLDKMVVLDVENYRARRERTLNTLARNVAKKVSKENKEQALEPMTPQERRIIHIALQEYRGVTTYSSGEEPYRKVVIKPQ